MTDILSDKGYRIDTAVDGVAALQVVVATHPDLVLLDIDMPRLRGGEALVAIRAISLAAGAFDYVTKPFDLNYLDEAVRIAMLS